VTEVVLPGRFNGPPGSANGGYVCGTLASLVGDGPVSVRLNRPPPLDRPLTWRDGRLSDGDMLLAEALPFAGEIPPLPPAVAEPAAEEATTRFAGLTRQEYRTCVGCGLDRRPGDGLRIFAGPVSGTDLVAAPWRPDASLAGTGGELPHSVVWTALDCPGGWAVMAGEACVLGTMLAQSLSPVRAGDALVVSARATGRDGRKRYAAVALHRPGGELVAWARQIWISPAA